MKIRLNEPDFIKGICIILMVFGHINYIGSSNSSQKEITAFIYTFHMPIFLIISGFFFNLIDNSKIQIINLLRTIGFPYVIFLTFYLLGLILIKQIGISTSNNPPIHFLSFIETIFLKPIGGYWFLHSLLILGLVLIFINKFLKSTFVFLLFSVICFTILNELNVVSIRTSIYFFSGYLIGILTKKNIIIPFIFSIIILMITIIFNIIIPDIYKFTVIQFLWCYMIFSILWSFATKLNDTYLRKIISWIGQNSLIILLMHSLFIVTFKPLSSFFLKIDSTGISYSVCVTVFTVMLSLIFAKFFDLLSVSKFVFNKEKLYVSFKK